MSFTKPRSVTLWGKELSAPSTWEDVYISVVSSLYEAYPEVFRALSSFPGSTRLEFGKTGDASRMTAPRVISEDFCIETNFSATDFVKRMKRLLSMCGAAYDDLQIAYERRTNTAAPREPLDNTPASKACEDGFYTYLQNTAKLADRTCSAYVSAIRSAERYQYGFKYDSLRERMRFRQFADGMGVPLPETDEELKVSVLAAGIVTGGKVYWRSGDMLRELQSMVDAIFASGATVIYYESLFEKEQEWMDAHGVPSPDILKEYLKNAATGCFFSKNFMARGGRRSEKEAVTGELKRVWGAHALESIRSLSARLPYVPPEHTGCVITGNPLFVPASQGKYLFIDRFPITAEEEEDILAFVEAACEENGFASLSDVPLGGIKEENYELTQPAI